jgi:hypothetical protein
MFRHRLVNMGLYGVLGVADALFHLAGAVRCDAVTIPDRAGALVMANIRSWAGGVHLPDLIADDDGKIDGLALDAGLGLGLTTLGLRQARHLAAASTWTITTSRALPMHCDGEPFLAPPGDWSVHHEGQVPVLMG